MTKWRVNRPAIIDNINAPFVLSANRSLFHLTFYLSGTTKRAFFTKQSPDLYRQDIPQNFKLNFHCSAPPSVRTIYAAVGNVVANSFCFIFAYFTREMKFPRRYGDREKL